MIDRDAVEETRERLYLALGGQQPGGAPAEIVLGLGQCDLLSGRYGEGLELLACRVGSLAGAELARAYRMMGRILERMGELDLACAHLDEGRRIRSPEPDCGPSGFLADLATLALRKGQYDLAMEYARGALDGEQLADRDLAHSILGICHYRQGRLVDSLGAHREALAGRERRGDQLGIANSLNNLGTVHQEAGQWTEALECFERGLQIMQTVSDTTTSSALLNNLATLHLSMGDLDRAEQVYCQALDEKIRTGESLGIAIAEANLATISGRRGDAEGAIAKIEEAIARLERQRAREILAEVYANYGELLTQVGRFDQAWTVFARALKAALSQGQIGVSARTLRGLAGLLLADGQFDGAAQLARRSVKLARQSGRLLELGHCLHGLAMSDRLPDGPAGQEADGIFNHLGLCRPAVATSFPEARETVSDSQRVAVEGLCFDAGLDQDGPWITSSSPSDFQDREVLYGILRVSGGLSSDASLQLLAVLARQVLACRFVGIAIQDAEDRLILRARAGCGAPSTGHCLGRSSDAADLAGRLADDPAFFEDVLRDPGPFEVLAMGGLMDGIGVLVIQWGTPGPSPAARAAANHVAEFAGLLSSQALLRRRASEGLAAQLVSGELARQRDAFVRQIVHDLRNSVHAMGLIVEDIAALAHDADRVRVAAATLDRTLGFVAAYLKDTVGSLEREHPIEPRASADLSAGLNRLVASCEPSMVRQGRSLRVGPSASALIRTSPQQLDQILEGVVRQAADLARPGGMISIWATVTDGWAIFYCQDDGPGLDVASRAALSPQKRANGLAVGPLATLETLVEAAGGSFGLRSRPGDWTQFYVGLPTISWGKAPDCDSSGHGLAILPGQGP